MVTLRHDPPMSEFDAAEARQIAEALRSLDGALLPILHEINDRFGYVDEAAVPIIADVLNLSRAEVHGVVSFYHDFRRESARRHVVRLCRAEACQSLGADRLAEQLQAALGTGGDVTVEAVYCLGNCALSPAALVDGKLYGRVTADAVMALVRT
jgi:formate dehydrogenase subunit gamma